MSEETQTTEGADAFFPITLIRGKGQAGFAIGGWTFSFILLELDLPNRKSDPIFNGQMTLSNGSTGATAVVSHVSGSVYSFSPEHSILSFSGHGEESLHGGPKFPVNVSALLAVQKNGHATGYIIVGGHRYPATAVVKKVQH